MTYTIIQKLQQAIPTIFGGGIRYRFVLTTLYPNPTMKQGWQSDATMKPVVVAASDDNISSDLTVDKAMFDLYEIGNVLTIGFYCDANAA